MNNKGYTLVELTLVVFLIGLMLFLAVPRVRETLISDGLTTTVRRIVGAAKALHIDAVREQVDYVLSLDLNNNAFWIYSLDMTPEKKKEMKESAFSFPEGVRIADASQIGVEKKTDGEITIRFYKQGNIQPTVIHLEKNEHYFTLVFSPFLSTVRVYDKLIDITPEGSIREL